MSLSPSIPVPSCHGHTDYLITSNQETQNRLFDEQAVLARLRSYKPPPFPTWDRLDVSRRAAVLVLLFADRRGDLRVVITMRAASLRNFSGMSPVYYIYIYPV